MRYLIGALFGIAFGVYISSYLLNERVKEACHLPMLEQDYAECVLGVLEGK